MTTTETLTIEELLARMSDLYGDEWEVKVTGDGGATVTWHWWSDGNPDDHSEDEEPTYEMGASFVNGQPLDVALAIATRKWTPADRACPECDYDRLRHADGCSRDQ